MSSTTYVILAATLIVLANGAPPEPKEPEMKCQGASLKISDDLIKARDSCFTKFNPGKTFDESVKSKGEEPKNMSCAAVCVMQQIGLVTADYKFDTSKVSELAKNNGFPEKAITSTVEAINTCIKDKGNDTENIKVNEGSSFEVKDGNCDSVLPVIQCSGEAVHKICGPSA